MKTGRKPADRGSLHRCLPKLDGSMHSWTLPVLKGLFALLMVVAGFSVSSAQSPTIDLSLSKAISKQNPSIGEVVTYTVVVSNAANMATATNVRVTDQLLTEGATYVPASASVSSGTFTSTSSATYTTGVWAIPSIPSGSSATLVFKATVQAPGVWFNIAEVTAADQADTDSQPNNQVLAEDDYETVCFSLPIVWFAGDEYTVSVPTGFDQVVWYRNDTPISTSTVSGTLATVNSDNSLTIKGPGSYRVETYKGGCQSGSCCNIVLVEGQLGSIGEVVWNDENADGKKDPDEPGIDGVVVELYDAATDTKLTSTTTANGGVYSFTGLTDGSYALRFVRPTGYTNTASNAPGVADTQNSDAGVNGFTRTYTINTTAPESSTARNNPTVYAGFVVPASLGNYVFADNDQNNVQSPGDTPIQGVKVTLSINGTPTSQTALTDATGLYSFTGLTPGSSYSYSVGFTAPPGFTAVTPLTGSDRTLDSDLLASGQTSSLTLASGENNESLDAGFRTGFDVGIAKAVAGGQRSFRPGDVVTFALTVTNNSANPVYNVVVKDQLPTGLSFVSGTGFSANGPQSVSAVLAGPLAPVGTTGSTASLTLSAQISNTFVDGTLTNVAVVTPFTSVSNADGFRPADTNPANNTATASVTVGAPALALTLAPAACNPATNGYTATGTVSFTNTIPGRLTIRDNGVEIASLTITAAQTSVPFTLTGVSNGPAPRTVTATLEGAVTLTKSTTYAVPQSCTLCNPIAMTLSGLRSTTVGAVYSQTLTASGGTAPYTFAVLNGSLPAGLTLNAATGVLSGTSTTAGVSAFTVVATDARACPGTAPYSLTVGTNSTCTVQPPFLVCALKEICKGGSTTMIARSCEGGTVRWSDGQTGFTISVTPTVTTAYTASCVIGACTSGSSNTITITVLDPQPPVITASADAVCPGTSVTLTAAGCEGGTIEWSEGAQTGSTIVVVPTTRTTYTAQCVLGSCPSRPGTKTIDMSTTLPTPTVTCSTTIACPGEEVTLSVNGCVGTPVWNSTTLTTGSIVVRPTLGNNSYTVYCQTAGCRSAVSKVYSISVVPATVPTVVASANAVCPGAPVSLTAIGCNGDVIWNATDRNGNVLTGSVITVNPQASINYLARCRYRICLSEPSSPVAVTVVNPQAPEITLTSGKNIVCSGEKVSLTADGCEGTVQWYGIDRVGASIDFYPTETKEYYATCKQGSCESDASLKIRVSVTTSGTATAPRIAASTTAVCGSGVVSLTATGCTSGTITWSDGQTGAIVSVTATPTNKEFYAICKASSGTACGSGRSNTINVNVTEVPAPTVTCSTTVVCPGEEVTLTVNGCVGTPIWSSTTLTTGSIVVHPTEGSNSYTVYCQNGTCRSPISNTYTIKVVPALPPTIVASATAVEPGGTVSLSATGCPGDIIWNAEDVNGNNMGEVIVVQPNGTQTYYAQCRYRTCLSERSLPIVINPGSCQPGALSVPTVSIDKPSVCQGDKVTLTATGCEGGQYIWSDNVTLGSSLTLTATATISYRVKCKVGQCEGTWSPSATVMVGAPPAPTVTVSTNSTAIISSVTVCFGSPVTLTAYGCPTGAGVVWSNNETGSSITVSPAASQTYTARCCTSDDCKSVPSNTLAITVLPKVAQPQVVDRTNACPLNTVDLTTAVTSATTTRGGKFEYYTNALLTSESKLTSTTVGSSGTYYVVEKTVSGCYSQPSAVHVQITTCGDVQPCDAANPATANAGTDATICAAKTYQLAGVLGGAGKTARWTTSGTGTFDNPFLLNATYAASTEDVLAGKVTLTLSVSTNNSACPVAKDNMVLTIEGSKAIPSVKVTGSTLLCYGDSVRLEAPVNANGYLWSNKARTQSIIVKTSGNYSVQLLDGNGCSSVKSADVVVKVAEPATAPLVANLRNTCPAVVANLSKALSGTTAGTTYEYRIGASASSQFVARPDSVGAGTYYVFARTAGGCVSGPAKVVVTIINCAADTISNDLAIAKIASTTMVQRGEPVTYTIRVTNRGKYTAKNIDIRDVLPKGLELVTGGTASYTVANGIITKRIDSLKAGKSDSIVFRARLVTKGTVVNTAEITYADQKDPNPANNKASVSVTDTTTYKRSILGLAKAVLGVPTTQGDSIRVSYRFVVKNYGDDTLRKVQVVDDLAFFYAPNSIVSAVVKTPAGSTLKPRAAFTGTGFNTSLFDSTSYLAPNRSQTFTLDLVVRRATGDTTIAFNNVAQATAVNSVTAVSELSVSGSDPDPDKDGNPTNNSGVTSFTLGAQQGPGIGLALAVQKVEKQRDNSYNVTYKATVRNYGTVDLEGISLTDSLVKTFAPPVSYTVVRTQVGTGSSLVLDANYDGNTLPNVLAPTSTLAAGAQDTVLIVVNVRLGTNKGPFLSTATVTGKPVDLTATVSDISNNGFDPKPEGSVVTPVRFDLPNGLLGVAKSVGTPVQVSEGVYDIPYTISVKNWGTVPLTKVQVVDNLSETFNHGALIVSNRIRVTTGTGLKVDTLYTGQGLLTKMLVDSLSRLAVGETRSLSFTVRVDVRNADSLTFNNTAKATAQTPDRQAVEDVSTAGANADPDNDADPRNNSVATPITLNYSAPRPYIGVALSVRDTVLQTDGSYNVTYQVVVKNYGNVPLARVAVSDTLARVFNSSTGAAYRVVSAPISVATGSTLKLNAGFDGNDNPLLVLGDSTSTLAPGQADSILVVVNVVSNGSTPTFLSTVYAEANAGSTRVADVSTNGLNPDLNGNLNPTDTNESEATPLTLPATSTTLFIPEGFSPNGDGINDLFVIRGAGPVTISFELYNRWGHMVYKNDDYQNDWDGKPNTGIMINGDAAGVPDGTYYYVIKLSDGRQFVRYMTINR